MPYKSIILEILQERPILHEQLRSNSELHSTMNRLAIQLREIHLREIERLRDLRPNSAQVQLRGEAMEIALQAIQEILPPEESRTEDELSLDGAMAFLKQTNQGQ